MATLTPALVRMAAFSSSRPIGFRLAAGAVDQRERHEDAAPGQFLGDAIAFGAMLQDEFEAELLGEADGRHDVVGAMAMEMDGALASSTSTSGSRLMSRSGGMAVLPSALALL